MKQKSVVNFLSKLNNKFNIKIESKYMPKYTSKNTDHYISTRAGWVSKNTVEEITFENAFPYELERVPLFDGSGNKADFNGTKYWGLRCSDTGDFTGKPVPDSYQHLSNERFWDIVQNAVGGTDAKVENVGTFKNRARRYITVALGTDMDQFYVGQREFKNRFCLLDSIDMSSSLYGVNTSICIVCQNSFNAAMQDKSGLFRFKVRHSKNMIEGIENMEKGIESFIGVAKQFKHAMEVAASIPVNREEASEAFTGWIMKDSKDKVMSTRTRNTVERLGNLFVTGAGNKGETLLDAFSAVTDYYSHESSGGQEKDGFRMKQNESSNFGAGNRAKQDFFKHLFTTPKNLDERPAFNPTGFKNLREIGRKVEQETQNQIAMAN